MTREVDPLLERIDRDLEECDARTLPALPSGPAEAVLDLAERAGVELTPWQASLIRTMYAYPDAMCPQVVPPARPSRPSTIRGRHADIVIVDDPIDALLDARRPWWRRWWSR